MSHLICIFLGGGLGAVLRYLLKVGCDKHLPLHLSNYPFGTFFANIIGCFFLGLIFTLFLNKTEINTNLKLFLTVGVAGGFTTFSTFSLESIELFKTGNVLVGILYITLSVLLGLLGVYLGMSLANNL